LAHFLKMNKKPRIVFLIPIASSRVMKNWPLACSYLRQTIESIFNSSNGNFCVVVAGHEAPDFDLPPDPRFKFLSLDHPIPSREDDFWRAAMRDKMTKLGAAWNYAKSTWNPDYVMKVDWDDLISSKLVDWLATAKDEAGYRVKDGWLWSSGSRHLIQRSETFDLICGTCLIIRNELADQRGPFLNSMDGIKFDAASLEFEAANNRSLIPGAGIGTLLLNDNHGRAEAQFKYLGHQLGVVPFKAAVYRVQNSQSVSGRGFQIHSLRSLLGGIRRTRFITSGLRREFNLH
jgi:hypothetical protein